MGLFKKQIVANNGEGRDALFRRPLPQRPRLCHFLLNTQNMTNPTSVSSVKMEYE